jgi:hypothetical protein
MENVSDRIVERIKIHILCSVAFFPENRAGYEIMWKNMVVPERQRMIIYGACALRAGYLRLHTRARAATMLSRTFSVTLNVQGGSNMTGTNCDLFTHK